MKSLVFCCTQLISETLCKREYPCAFRIMNSKSTTRMGPTLTLRMGAFGFVLRLLRINMERISCTLGH